MTATPGDRHHDWRGRQKVRYPTRGEAKRAMRTLYGKSVRSTTMQAYRCPTCEGFHLGHANHKEP